MSVTDLVLSKSDFIESEIALLGMSNIDSVYFNQSSAFYLFSKSNTLSPSNSHDFCCPFVKVVVVDTELETSFEPNGLLCTLIHLSVGLN